MRGNKTAAKRLRSGQSVDHSDSIYYPRARNISNKLTKLASATVLLLFSNVVAGCSNSEADAAQFAAQAEILLDQKRFAEARQTIAKSIAARDDVVEYHLLRGRIEYLGGSFENAFSAYSEALALSPSNEEFFTHSGFAVINENSEITFYKPPGSNPKKYGYIILDKKDADEQIKGCQIIDDENNIPKELRDKYQELAKQTQVKKEKMLKDKADAIEKDPTHQANLASKSTGDAPAPAPIAPAAPTAAIAPTAPTAPTAQSTSSDNDSTVSAIGNDHPTATPSPLPTSAHSDPSANVDKWAAEKSKKMVIIEYNVRSDKIKSTLTIHRSNIQDLHGTNIKSIFHKTDHARTNRVKLAIQMVDADKSTSRRWEYRAL